MAYEESKKIDSILKEKISSLAKIFFADKDEVNITEFNHVLTENNINYKEYVTTGKSRLRRFLTLFPETLTIEEKKINGGTQYYCRLIKQIPVLNGVQEEVTQMHSIAFMSWWINNVKVLQKYTDQTRTTEEWRSIVARGFSYALLGETPLFCYSINQDTKIVFNTGIKTLKGNSVFCVLRPNPNNTLGNLQPYAMESFCCVAEEDNEISNEIKQNSANWHAIPLEIKR